MFDSVSHMTRGDIRAVFTNRHGGCSKAPFAAMNLATHVGDDPAAVASNRQQLADALQAPGEIRYLAQVHGNRIVTPAEIGTERTGKADGWYSDTPGEVLAIMVADCLPVMIAALDTAEIAVLHAGWRGLASGIIAAGVKRFRGQELLAWVGPGIGPCHYEVDAPVVNAFPDGSPGFTASRPGHWQADLKAIAAAQLAASGVVDVAFSKRCTACEGEDYYSARRDGECGRMAAVIWREGEGALEGALTAAAV